MENMSGTVQRCELLLWMFRNKIMLYINGNFRVWKGVWIQMFGLFLASVFEILPLLDLLIIVLIINGENVVQYW